MTSLSSAVRTDSDLYRFGLWVGLRTLPRALVHGLKLMVLPVEYIRCAEGRYVLQHLNVASGQRVLDVGSPKLLSLFLAARIGAEVHATDLIDYFFGRYAAYADAVMQGRRGLYTMRAEDGRALSYSDGTFDRVFAISAIEHIAGDGDTLAIREFGRVLKPGGLVCLTVPWSDGGYVEQFKHAGDRDAYWVKSSEPTVFYQRAYDRQTLMSRLVESGPFELEDLTFWGERKIPVEDCILSPRLPKLIKWALLPAHFPLSRVFLTPMGENEPSRKKVACLTLRRT